jgi:hypothetical protein
MAFCILRGDSFRSLAIAGSEVLSIVESSICIKIAVAKISGNIFFIELGCETASDMLLIIGIIPNFIWFKELKW